MNGRYYIIGIKHCGKSTIGQELAKALNIPFYDLDDQIEKDMGISVRELYKTKGREAFKKAEAHAVKSLQSSKLGFICATGGGICDNKEAYSLLKSLNSSIYINTSFNTAYSRIEQHGTPAFLKSDNPKEEFMELYTRRNKLYKAIASLEFNGDNITPQDLVDNILYSLKEHKIVGK